MSVISLLPDSEFLILKISVVPNSSFCSSTTTQHKKEMQVVGWCSSMCRQWPLLYRQTHSCPLGILELTVRQRPPPNISQQRYEGRVARREKWLSSHTSKVRVISRPGSSLIHGEGIQKWESFISSTSEGHTWGAAVTPNMARPRYELGTENKRSQN